MAKKPTLSDISNIPTAAPIINANNQRIENAFENTLSLDGSTPNAMQADLDMNSHNILNVESLSVQSLTVDGNNLQNLAEAVAEDAAAAAVSEANAAASALSAAADAAVVEAIADTFPDPVGAWTTATAYGRGDIITINGGSEICLIAHTSGVFATDKSNGRWQTLAEKGNSGAGTGDMLAAQNLNDVADKPTARSNLGLGSMATQAAGAVAITGGSITGITDLAVADGGTGASTASAARTNLGLGALATANNITTTEIAAATLVTAADGIASNDNDTTIPTSAAVKDYVDNTVPTGWTLISSSNTWTGGSQTVSGLEAYSRVMVLGDQLTADTSGRRRLRVGSGGSILTTSIYQDLGPSRGTFFDVTGTTVNGRAFSLVIERFNTSDPVKRVDGNYDGALSTNGPSHVVTTSILDRIQVYNEAGNINGGTLYVWGMV